MDRWRLGHRRLSIIDVAGGAQPMSNEDGSVWVTYNGELYNEPGLRKELEARHHRYRTTCDTESLVHLYEEEGPEFVRRLNGMFALAIWDRRRETLVLLATAWGRNRSTMRRCLAVGWRLARSPRRCSRIRRSAGSSIVIGWPATFFMNTFPPPVRSGVRFASCPAAHLLTWTSGGFRVSRYWDPPVSGSSPTRDFGGTAERFWTEFRESVARHRRSDVPIGVFFSGGVDSSSVAAALCEVEPARNVRTFSIGFEDPSFDESGHARAVAAFLGTDHHERTFSVKTAYDFCRRWPAGLMSRLATHRSCQRIC